MDLNNSGELVFVELIQFPSIRLPVALVVNFIFITEPERILGALNPSSELI